MRHREAANVSGNSSASVQEVSFTEERRPRFGPSSTGARQSTSRDDHKRRKVAADFFPQYEENSYASSSFPEPVPSTHDRRQMYSRSNSLNNNKEAGNAKGVQGMRPDLAAPRPRSGSRGRSMGRFNSPRGGRRMLEDDRYPQYQLETRNRWDRLSEEDRYNGNDKNKRGRRY